MIYIHIAFEEELKILDFVILLFIILSQLTIVLWTHLTVLFAAVFPHFSDETYSFFFFFPF